MEKRARFLPKNKEQSLNPDRDLRDAPKPNRARINIKRGKRIAAFGS